MLKVLFVLLLCTSCATLVNGPREDISISTIPPGATVTDGVCAIETPGVLNLARKSDHLLLILKPGFQPEEVRIKHVLDGWVAGNALTFGMIGAGIDAATGSMWQLKPQKVALWLVPKQAESLHPPFCKTNSSSQCTR